ncbi:bifunctional hydroxymethylpyrimidine kinase/phosphomethylpyrimidine kinase [Aurantimonas marianensis]|uniref:hydroxymethylpyrimidine kinase n=1 Tax=Aurantimonas marianensis TaxID=2920428 RepID=A0A9X2KIX1_9HYPH|nr:hydroxymethylpyrimidine/phosphomethylpyrimidine kinase [Aurantimonas marianensis]MCP3056037.1 hydroxymethylpyrimidine/phosphomethylpyrimidine kinase [Aurantimonas marianensis]
MDRVDASLASSGCDGRARVTVGRPVVLAIAGSDSSGGAGIAADIRAAQDLGATLRFALTAVTAQSDRQVTAIHPVPLDTLREQIRVALQDGTVGAIKIGMLGSAAAIETVADLLARYPALPVVLDPVVASSSGRRLLDPAAMSVLIARMLPLATLLTPNLPELEILARAVAGVEPPPALSEQAEIMLAAGTKAVLAKGGHDRGDDAVDRLFQSGDGEPNHFISKRLPVAMRGSGCMLSTAICVALAQGDSLAASCRRGKSQMTTWFERMERMPIEA